MDFSQIENSYDFSSMSRYFKSEAEISCFENLCSAIDYICENRIRDLDFLEFYYYLENKISNKYSTERLECVIPTSKFSSNTLVLIPNFNNACSYYDAYLLLKYMTLSEVSKQVLDALFSKNIFTPENAYQMHGNEFVQNFFYVAPGLDYRLVVKVLFCFPVKENMQVFQKVQRYYRLFRCLQNKIKFIYFLTQNINFDKTSFSNDFLIRHDFVHGIFDLELFSPMYLNSVTYYEQMRAVLTDANLEQKIRRRYCNMVKCTDQWTFANLAKKMDKSQILHSDPHERYNFKVVTHYVEKEFVKLRIYTQFIEAYESNLRNLRFSFKSQNSETQEFFVLVSDLLQKIPFDLARLRQLQLNSFSNLY